MSILRIFNDSFVICAQEKIFIVQNNEVNHIIDISCFFYEENNKEEKNSCQKINEIKIIDGCFSELSDFFAVISSNKRLLVFNTEKWSLVGCIKCLSKAPSVVHFDLNNDIIVSDRSGSVHKFMFESLSLKESNSIELLGHCSMILDFCFSKDGRYILTVDRDEKLRISHYPQTFIIENFCLGHTAFINSVVILNDYISATAGGDSIIFLWNFFTGKSVFVSEKICDLPIRKLIVSNLTNITKKLGVLPNNSNIIKLFDFDEQKCILNNLVEYKLETDDIIFDIAFDKFNNLFVLGRNGIYVLENSKLTLINIKTNQILNKNLQLVSEIFPLSKLYKVTGFENKKIYNKKKEEKLQRKRKFNSEIIN